MTVGAEAITPLQIAPDTVEKLKCFAGIEFSGKFSLGEEAVSFVITNGAETQPAGTTINYNALLSRIVIEIAILALHHPRSLARLSKGPLELNYPYFPITYVQKNLPPSTFFLRKITIPDPLTLYHTLQEIPPYKNDTQDKLRYLPLPERYPIPELEESDP